MLQRIEELIQEKKFAQVREAIIELNSADIALLMENLNNEGDAQSVPASAKNSGGRCFFHISQLKMSRQLLMG